jgi:hypothetical protein
MPTMTAAGSVVFPAQSGGLVTPHILDMSDLGLRIGHFLASAILRQGALLCLAFYLPLFAAMTAIMAASGVVFAIARRRSRDVSTV